MIYCEGKYCSIKNQCAFHEAFEWKHPRQYLDWSTEGSGYGGFDKEKNYHFFSNEYCCGDRAKRYSRYRALGWREK